MASGPRGNGVMHLHEHPTDSCALKGKLAHAS